ncbi:hypothetical protein NW754_013335 [Fusarium falciforme]|uniref:VOC domain-containing protein n=1 Tax=Fusarium falciforme TaxID=195108 RepID=A0A9W8QXM4_9HYPO|nr:hypothetical protein NW754_013335 [Fusarium falciforme]KAJ4180670.1 hypothetical protein NW755_14971 [Fusarium falciforme]
MPPRLGQIVETILYTSSVPSLVAWYKDVFSITPFESNEALAGFSLPNDSILLLFDRSAITEDRHPPGGTIPKHGCPTGLGQHIAFACNGKEELKEWEEHFKVKGVEIIGRMEWERGGSSVYVKDWEGHVIEVMTRNIWQVY